jgi:M3 family oligoendopeptidase
MFEQDSFSTFVYQRPDIEELRISFNTLLDSLSEEKSIEGMTTLLSQINELRDNFNTQYNLCFIRHTVDSRDAFYKAENDFFDRCLPSMAEMNSRLYSAVLSKPALEERLGSHFFVLLKLAGKTFTPGIEPLLEEENKFSTEYSQIKAQAQISFRGGQYNLSSIQPFELSDDRETRREAQSSRWMFYSQEAHVLEGIYDKLVFVRDAISQKLGFKNFTEVGYARMRRSDYTPELVAKFRKQVLEQIVPLASALYERQRNRIGVDCLLHYDEDYTFKTGNPRPIGTPEEIIENAAVMYQELSPETNTFFKMMRQRSLMDLENRDGKVPMGYCTYLPGYRAPFIFSNFNGTSGDIDVLTHEAGHAFQVWQTGQHIDVEEYLWPTSDAAEIHSMSMEFLTWPWMPRFFGADTNKYYYMHLSNAVKFLPYGVAVDEFQHVIYENPKMSVEDRNVVWRNLEKTYLPHRNYAGNPFLERGGYWLKQGHLFTSPFYYIDYALAQICAFQFWIRGRENPHLAWENYLKLCKAGGSQSFLNLVKLGKLRSPFEPRCMTDVILPVRRYLEAVDDSKF